jgi:hypothetical protein
MPAPLALGWAAAAAALAALSALVGGGPRFAPGACERLEPFLAARVAGQDLALRQLADAVCDHLAAARPPRPLVLSLHGPPGVGKSLTHALAARALFARDPAAPGLRCPGPDCAGYRVLQGLDYGAEARAAQHAALRGALAAHAAAAPQALIVIEEYDKLDCHMRGFFRTLLAGDAAGNASLSQAIVLLESNTGYTELHAMLEAAGGRERIAPEAAQRALKDLVFERWLAQGCEERADTLKMVGLVDFFLPFFPLEESHVRRLFAHRLAERGAELAAEGLGGLAVDPKVVDFLVARVDFEGRFPIEGGKEVGTLVTRHASRPLRGWAAARRAEAAAARTAGGKRGAPLPGGGRLAVASGGAALEVVPDAAAVASAQDVR